MVLFAFFGRLRRLCLGVGGRFVVVDLLFGLGQVTPLGADDFADFSERSVWIFILDALANFSGKRDVARHDRAGFDRKRVKNEN